MTIAKFYTNFILESSAYSIEYTTYEEAVAHLQNLVEADRSNSAEVYGMSITESPKYSAYLPDGTPLEKEEEQNANT